MSKAQIVAAAALVGVSASLLTVGLVSTPPTFWRHVVQIIPAMVVLIMVVGGVRGWPLAAGVIFLFWLLIVIAIWLFLLRAATIVSGTFSQAEIVLTEQIALWSLGGLVAAAYSARGSRWLQGIAVFVIAAGIQYGAMWLSQQPIFRQTTPLRGRIAWNRQVSHVPGPSAFFVCKPTRPVQSKFFAKEHL